MGGRLTVQSEHGMGSTFTLNLLAADRQLAELATVSSAKGEGERE
jgi:hypothetical protein